MTGSDVVPDWHAVKHALQAIQRTRGGGPVTDFDVAPNGHAVKHARQAVLFERTMVAA